MHGIFGVHIRLKFECFGHLTLRLFIIFVSGYSLKSIVLRKLYYHSKDAWQALDGI